MPVGLPGLAAACFLILGVYCIAPWCAEYPDIGSTLFPGGAVGDPGILDWL